MQKPNSGVLGFEQALKREVFEEAGHHLLDPGSWIWTREWNSEPGASRS